MSDEFSDAGFQDMADALLNQGHSTVMPARFFVEPVRDEQKTKEAGREIFVDSDMIEIRVGKDIIRRPPSAEDKKNYARQYAAFKAGQDQEKVEGTPLSEFSALSRGEVETLRYAGIRTVEQFAATADSTLQNLGPLLTKRQIAADWLKKSQLTATLSKLHNDNKELRTRLEAAERMLSTQAAELQMVRNGNPAQTTDRSFEILAEIQKRMAELEAAQKAVAPKPEPVAEEPKRRGRPPGSKNKPKVNGVA